MSSTTTLTRPEDIHLSPICRRSSDNSDASGRRLGEVSSQAHEDAPEPPADAFEAIPDGGLQAWTQIFVCASFLFWTNGWATTWGVLQAAILRSSFLKVDTATLSFVGSLALACLVAFSLFWVRVMRTLGARNSCVLAAVLMSSGTILASTTLDNLGGLFCTAGVLFGLGSSALYNIGNALPVQWFSSKLGLSNGLVKAGGGIGATILPIASQKCIDKLGLPWTFRAFGIIQLLTTVSLAMLIKERRSGGQTSRIEWSLLKNIPFLCLCLGGAVTVWALFVPPFFIPLFAHSIGLSPSTGAGLVAGFGASSTVGRLIGGHACDRIGPLNTLSITLLFNFSTMLAIWTVSSSLGPLTLFAVVNGIANGSFFSATPVAVSSLAPPDLAAGAMGVGISFWTPGYLLGTSIAGILISKTHAADSSSIEPYRETIFYAGGVALLGAILVLASRFRSDGKIVKRL